MFSKSILLWFRVHDLDQYLAYPEQTSIVLCEEIAYPPKNSTASGKYTLARNGDMGLNSQGVGLER